MRAKEHDGSIDLSPARPVRGIWLAVSALLLAGCGSGDGDRDVGIVRAALCTGTHLAASPAGPIVEGTNVALTASGTTCATGEAAEYRFVQRRDGTADTVEIRGFGPGTNATFPTSGILSGKYLFNVFTRAQGSTGPGRESATVALLIGNVCNSVKLTASPKSPQPRGGTVTFTGNATCTGGTPQYQFLVQRPGATGFALLRDWGGATFAWNDAQEAVGQYSFLVRARAIGNLSVSESQTSIPYRIGETCTLLQTTTSPPSPAPFGTTVGLSATSSCTGGTAPRYRFSVRSGTSTALTVIRDWAPAATASWSTAGITESQHSLLFEVRASDFAGAATSSKTVAYQLGQVCTAVALTTSVPSPVLRSTRVTLTGSATCSSGGGAEYRFFERTKGTTAWTLIRDWSTEPTAPMNTNALPRGQYQFRVDARSQGTFGDAEATRVIDFVIGPKFTRQFGTSGEDFGIGVALDAAGNVYGTGGTSGGLDGNTSAGGFDTYIAKYTSTGTRIWTRQFGTALEDSGSGGIATDTAGNVYVAGHTFGGLDSYVNAGGADVFVTKYSASGTRLWLLQFGSSGQDFATGVSTDSSGNIYVSGFTDGSLDGNASAGGRDAFVAKYTKDGLLVWMRQFGTAADEAANAISAPDQAGNVYVTGNTLGALVPFAAIGGYDLFVAKLASNGAPVWIRQTGTPKDDVGLGIATSPVGNVYVTGYSAGNFAGGPGTSLALITLAYDGAGTELWRNERGTPGLDEGEGVATDSAGNVYVCAVVSDSDRGTGNDANVIKFSPTGAFMNGDLFVTPGDDIGASIAVDATGAFFLFGSTAGTFTGATSAGGTDAFLIKARM